MAIQIFNVHQPDKTAGFILLRGTIVIVAQIILSYVFRQIYLNKITSRKII